MAAPQEVWKRWSWTGPVCTTHCRCVELGRLGIDALFTLPGKFPQVTLGSILF